MKILGEFFLDTHLLLYLLPHVASIGLAIASLIIVIRKVMKHEGKGVENM